MANILLDGANWLDGFSTPTPTWDGTSYDIIGQDNGGASGAWYHGCSFTYSGTINNGDMVAGSITSTSADTTSFSITVNGTPATSQSLTTGQTFPFSFSVASGDNVTVNVGVGDSLYSQDAVMTPSSGHSLFAPDLTLQVAQNSSASVVPQLVLDGSNVPTTGLSIVTNPENGSAVTNTPALTYAPNLGYNGSDSFQYQGMAFDGTVDSVTITNGGVGYTSAPSVTFGEPISGTQAQGTAVVAGGQITGVTVTNSGTGYKTPPSVSFGTGIGTGATATAVLGQITSNVANVAVTVTPIPCQEMGRVTRAYVSAYQRNRVHESNCFSQENRCLIANFNGAVPIGRTIASVTWSCLNPFLVNMLQADVTGRETACVVRFQYGGVSLIRCAATFDNGEVYVQMFRLNVSQPIWFQGDTNFSTGPYTLVAVPASTSN